MEVDDEVKQIQKRLIVFFECPSGIYPFEWLIQEINGFFSTWKPFLKTKRLSKR